MAGCGGDGGTLAYIVGGAESVRSRELPE
uniref:Uncharacterized protein n=1 Tax=Arundo donax TaxID=35708 RepID=A0A0A8Y7E1_ARUDO